MKIGYLRVSTLAQSNDRQRDILERYQLDRIIEDKATGTNTNREGLQQLLGMVRHGDEVYVESISRLGRNTLEVLSIVKQFEDTGVTFHSHKENMDTSTSTGKAMFQMMVVLAELERNLISDRVKESLQSSKARGKHIGRPYVDNEKIDVALRMYDSRQYSVREICRTVGIGQGTLYRYLQKRKEEQETGSPSS